MGWPARRYDPFDDDLDRQDAAEVALIAEATTDAVVEALTKVAQGGTAVVIQNLSVNVNYASGGGATVTVH